jgi:hypothetical protein
MVALMRMMREMHNDPMNTSMFDAEAQAVVVAAADNPMKVLVWVKPRGKLDFPRNISSIVLVLSLVFNTECGEVSDMVS